MLKDSVFLGTAAWGQRVTKDVAYQVLGIFYQSGFRWVDTATNYPIDGNPESYGKTIEWLSDFQADFPGLRIFVKAGSATNLGEPTQLINASYFKLICDLLVGELGESLGGLGVHWDNDALVVDRAGVIDFYSLLHDRGLSIGLSGIANPEIYSTSAVARALPWIIQRNLSPVRTEQIGDELQGIRSHFPNAKIFGYNLLGGVNARGLADGPDRLSRVINSSKEGLGLMKGDLLRQIITRSLDLKMDGFIIGATNVDQWSQWSAALRESFNE